MELPKNIVQIGKPDKLHKIFVEDYVVSYIKKVGRSGGGEAVGLALYGRAYEENDCSYYFLYCAAKVEGIEHRGPYLSQVEKEEAVELGKRHFPEQDFLAWCSVREELADSIYILKQGKGIEVCGYACFYEKNESMLNYMLALARQEKREESTDDTAPGEKTARGEWKAETYKKQLAVRTDEAGTRREKEKREEAGSGYGRMVAAAALFALCLLGIGALGDPEKRQELQVTAQQVIASLSEQKLAEEVVEQDITPASDVSGAAASAAGQQVGQTDGTEEKPDNWIVRAETDMSAAGEEPVSAGQQEETGEQTAAAPVLYTIVKGDTLISICRAKYGNMDRMQEICELNQISNPDSIAVGQTILLPQ